MKIQVNENFVINKMKLKAMAALAPQRYPNAIWFFSNGAIGADVFNKMDSIDKRDAAKILGALLKTMDKETFGVQKMESTLALAEDVFSNIKYSATKTGEG